MGCRWAVGVLTAIASGVISSPVLPDLYGGGAIAISKCKLNGEQLLIARGIDGRK
jgi:hypothetical protein